MTFYTTTQIAEMFHVSIWTVYKWRKEGRLPATKFGRSCLITQDDIDVFLSRTPLHKKYKKEIEKND